MPHDESVLLSRLNGGAWSSGFSLTGNPGDIEITQFVLGSSAEGLGMPSTVLLGEAPAGTTHGLTSQFRSDASLFTDQAAIGAALVRVDLSPAPGRHERSFQPVFAVSNPSYVVFHTTDPAQGWSSGKPPRIFADSTLYYYALHQLSQRRTEIHRAIYTFADAPGQLDSDGDGVPDFVEDFYGLDPRGGDNSDGDKYSDLLELLNGTDPNDAGSPNAQNNDPATLLDHELRSVFDLKLGR